jgi:hypothetical protein
MKPNRQTLFITAALVSTTLLVIGAAIFIYLNT